MLQVYRPENRGLPLLQLLHCYTAPYMMTPMRLPAAALVLILAMSAASAETIAGRASVIDGDTIDIHGARTASVVS